MALDFDRVTAWFKEKGVTTICPVCRSSGFKVADEFAGLPQHDGEKLNINRAYLQVNVICRNCGHIRNFSAKVMGLTED